MTGLTQSCAATSHQRSQASPDLALALAGLDSLRALVTDWDFDEAGFADCVGPALELLARLLQGTAELDTQLQARAPAALGSMRMPRMRHVLLPAA
jgi:hypothetical protein